MSVTGGREVAEMLVVEANANAKNAVLKDFSFILLFFGVLFLLANIINFMKRHRINSRNLQTIAKNLLSLHRF